jgi:hypothetical protein
MCQSSSLIRIQLQACIAPCQAFLGYLGIAFKNSLLIGKKSKIIMCILYRIHCLISKGYNVLTMEDLAIAILVLVIQSWTTRTQNLSNFKIPTK